MDKRKRMLQLVLCFLLCVVIGNICSIKVYAASGTYYGTGFTLYYDQISSASQECYISRGTASSGAKIVVPEEIDGLKVTRIAEHAFEGKYMSAVELPDTIEHLGLECFKNCYSLTSVVLSKNLKNICYGAFNGCWSLTSINIPDSVESIDAYAFYGCSKLASVEIPDSVESIDAYAFYECYKLASVEIPNSVKKIGIQAFYNCYGLTSILWGNGLTEIGNEAFSGCTGIKEVSLGNQISALGKKVFYGCSQLKTVVWDGSVTSIPEYAFYGCSQLVSVTIPEGITEYGDYCFYNCGNLSTIDLRGNVISIGNRAFHGCTKLELDELPNSITSIGTGAFYNCQTLNVLTLPNQLTTIPAYAFQNCKSLTVLEIPANINEIGTKAFYGCSGLKKVILPENLSVIPEECFNLCSALQYVKFGSDLTTIGQKAFYNCGNLKAIIIPDGVTEIQAKAMGYIEQNNAVAAITTFTIYENACQAAVDYAVNNGFNHKKTGEEGTPTGEIIENIEDSPQDEDGKITYVISKDTVLGQNGTAPYAGVYCYDGNLTLNSGVQLTSSGISQMVLIVKGKLTIKQGAAIRVRNGYYADAPSTKISNINADTMILYGIEDTNKGIMLFPNTYGKGGDGGAGGNGGNGSTSLYKANGNGGNGGGGGYGGGNGGAAGKAGTGYKTAGNDGYTGASNGAGSCGGGATGLGKQGANNASSASSPGGGGGGNGGDGGSTSYGSQYIMASGGSGGGGGYGGGVLTIYADSIEVESTVNPVFIAHGQCGGVRGIGGNSGENGQNGEGGMLIIQTNDYTYNTAHWTTSRTSKTQVGESYTSYSGGHSSLIHTKPQAVFVNGVKICTGSEQVPEKWDVKQLSDCTIQSIDVQDYTGQEIKPDVVIKNQDGIKLTKDVDYTVCYSNNIEPGYALVTVNGKGDYRGELTKTFIIKCNHRPGSLQIKSEPTCIQDGVGYICCEICEAVLDNNVSIEALGHKECIDLAVEPSCTSLGYTKGSHCSVCNVVLSKQEIIPALGHDLDVISNYNGTHYERCQRAGCDYAESSVACSGGTATCNNKAVCSICGAEYGTFDVTKHVNTQVVNKKEANCKEEGYSGDTYCMDCKKIVAEGQVIERSAIHVPGEAVKEKEQAPTCTIDGACEEVTYCDICGEEISRTPQILPATGHTYVNGICKDCGQILSFTEGGLTYTVVTNTDGTANITTKEDGTTSVSVSVKAADQTVEENKIEGIVRIPSTVQTMKETNTDTVFSVTLVEENAFANTEGVTAVVIPKTVDTIESGAFKGCGELQEITFNGERAPVIAEDAFVGVSDNIRVYVPENASGYTAENGLENMEIIGYHVHVLVKTDEIEATCLAEGKKAFWTCSDCHKVYADAEATLEVTDENSLLIAKKAHMEVIDAAVPATCTEDGKTSGLHCSVCNMVIKGQETIKAAGHTWDAGRITVPATEDKEGVKTFTCTCGETRTEPVKKLEKQPDTIVPETDDDTKEENIPDEEEYPKVGDTFTVKGIIYKVIKSNPDEEEFEVSCIGTDSKKIVKLDIPNYVSDADYDYEVVSIGKKAFSGCKKLKNVSIGDFVIDIDNQAFYGCISLKKITIPNKTKKIGVQAFAKCKMLSLVNIKSSLLTEKNVGKQAFAGINKNAVVKVPSKKKAVYKKWLKKKGLTGKKQKVK